MTAVQAYYRGTKADLKLGDLIEPGYVSNFGTSARAPVRSHRELSVVRDRFSGRQSSAGPDIHMHMPPTDLIFTDRGYVDVVQLNALYRLVGWDRDERRTAAETLEMLRVSSYYITGVTTHGRLLGFARVCGDPYIVQVLDVITHPEYRHQGIATRCMAGVLAHLQQSRYVSVTLVHADGLDDFYQRFGFRAVGNERTRAWVRDAV